MNTVDQKEIQNFSKDSSHWWDESGPFKPLHRLNPTRLHYIKQQICAHFDRDVKDLNSYEGLDLLDIGCGGGLVCEPLARLGGAVSGIDADQNAIKVATAHAAKANLEIKYEATSSEQLLDNPKRYDVVLALEIIEHVSDPELFVKSVLALCKPDGLVIFSTLNRTPKSFALGIVAAEYLLRWVPMGTHDWKKFVKPAELSRHIRSAGGKPKDICGLAYSPLKNEYSLKPHDTDVNYFMSVLK
jgi:2-polyprenyl-6-hydroxyphenyl methylase/3-demethylubiquinone-9 3-methyltransferase